MSTLTHLESSRQTAAAPRERMISGPLALVFVSEFATLTCFYLLLSVMPRYAARAGAGNAGAGLVTGALLLGTVAAELASAALMRRCRYRTLLAAGAALMGLPCLALLAGGPLVIVAAVSVVRGFGFGLGTVVMGALAAMLLPPERRGEGLGVYGVVASLPGVLALPAGVWLAGHCGFAVVVLITAATAVGPLAAFWSLPGTVVPGPGDPGMVDPGLVDPGPGDPGPGDPGPGDPGPGDPGPGDPGQAGEGAAPGLLAGLRHPGELRLALIFAATTVAGGVVVSFLPLAAGASGSVAAVGLLAQALTATAGRWWEGRHGDRHGHARLLVPGLVATSFGMITMVWLATPATVVAGMCLFGAGFGIIQNATLALMIDRLPASGLGTASALWNLAYDAGYGAGPVVFGLFAGHTGYPAAFALTGVLVLAALPAARRERSGHGRRRGGDMA